MVYKALVEIGEYKPGDIVPDDKAKHWLEVYSVPQVELVTGKEKPKEEPEAEKEPDSEKEEPKDELEEKEKVSSEGESKKKGSSVMIDDYLDRNTNVVAYNIRNDNLDGKTLEELLLHEKTEKNRDKVISAIETAMKEPEGD